MFDPNNSCQTCHKWPEEELKARIDTIQGRTFEMRGVAMDALMALIADSAKAKVEHVRAPIFFAQ